MFSSRGRCVNKRVPSADQATVDVLPRDITVLPHVLGSDLIDYLTATSAATAGTPDDWDPFAEAADVIDPRSWYVTSFDANARAVHHPVASPERIGVADGPRLFAGVRHDRADQVRLPRAVERLRAVAPR